MDEQQTKAIFQAINDAAVANGVDPMLMLKIANAESGFNPKLPAYEGTSAGLYMFNDATWAETDSGKAGLSRFDPVAAATEAAKAIANGELYRWYASVGAWGSEQDVSSAKEWLNNLPPALRQTVLGHINRDWESYGGDKPTQSGRTVLEAATQYVPTATQSAQIVQPTPSPIPTVGMMREPEVLGTATIANQPKLQPKKTGLQQLGSDIKQVGTAISTGLSKAYRENLGQFDSFIPNPYVTGEFGAKNYKYWGDMAHEGTDFRAAIGTPVVMPEGWTVVRVSDKPTGTYGRNIQLRNNKTGELIQFAHLDTISLKVGDTTMTGTAVGTSGNTGSNAYVDRYDPHLHVNYWDASGKRSDVTKAMKEFSNVVYSAQAKPSLMDKIVRPAMASEKESSRQFSSTIVPTPRQTMPTNQVQPPISSSVGGARLIKSGETLSNIAKEYNTNYQSLLKMNPQIKDPNKIYAGDALNVPQSRVVVPTTTKKPTSLSSPMTTPKQVSTPVKQPKTVTGTSFKIW